MKSLVTREAIAAFLTSVLDDVLSERCRTAHRLAPVCPLAVDGRPCPLAREVVPPTPLRRAP